MLPSISAEIWQAMRSLQVSLPEKSSVPEIEFLLNRTVLLGGKRLRPLLAFLIADAIGIALDRVVPYARAAEFTHAATLAHDDVIDEAEKRRRRPTLNAVSSNCRAVLAGDFLLARALGGICSQNRPELVASLAQVLEELVSGEWLQLEARGVADVGVRHLDEVARKKTGSLIAWCCTVAPSLKECSPEVVERFAMLGQYIGVAFQMVDDVLDYGDDPEKPFAQDLREGLVNFVSFHLMDQNPEIARELRPMLGKISGDGEFRWPFAQAPLDRAKATVQHAAEAKIFAAKEIFSSLVRDLSLDPQAASVRALFELMDQIVKRKT